jgi:hypothetical protein
MNGGTVRYTGGYTIASGETTDIFAGDAVILDGTPAGDGNNIAVAVAGGDIVGIFAGCQYVAANGDVVWSNRWVANTVTSGAQPAEAFVYTDTDIVFSVQMGTAAGVITNAAIGQFADLDATTSGNAATGISGMELGTPGAGIAQFQILGLAKGPDGIYVADLSAANARVEVQIAESIYEAPIA